MSEMSDTLVPKSPISSMCYLGLCCWVL